MNAQNKSREALKPPHDLVANSNPQKESTTKFSMELPGDSLLEALSEEENVALSGLAAPRPNVEKAVPGVGARVVKVVLRHSYALRSKGKLMRDGTALP